MLAQHAQPRRIGLVPIRFPHRAALIVAVIAFMAVAVVAGWALYDRVSETPTERLALDVAHVWSSNDIATARELYTPDARLIAADGTEHDGIAAIASATAASVAAGVTVHVAGPPIESGRHIALPMTHRSIAGDRAVLTVLELNGDGHIVRQYDFARPSTPPRSWHMGAADRSDRL
jgi:hypothetical protein